MTHDKPADHGKYPDLSLSESNGYLLNECPFCRIDIKTGFFVPCPAHDEERNDKPADPVEEIRAELTDASKPVHPQPPLEINLLRRCVALLSIVDELRAKLEAAKAENERLKIIGHSHCTEDNCDFDGDNCDKYRGIKRGDIEEQKPC